MSNNLKQSNILLCGSSRVGKSTLINAICQQKLAKTSASLNSLTKEIERYSYEYSNGQTSHETVIWDTPGIESWKEDQVRRYMASLIEQTQPLCMIYCASPQSFAILDHVRWLVYECYRQKIFCALVCTNMWSGRNREEIVGEFCKVLSIVHPNIQPVKEDNVIYYGRHAVVTMVNSEEYFDKDFDVRKPPSGVEELIFAIAKSLNRDLMFAWFRSVAQNTSFWSKMSSKLSNLLKVPTESFAAICGHAASYLEFLFDPSSFSDDYPISTADDNTSFTETQIFHDAVMVDMPQQIQYKKLTFTFKSEDTKTTVELSQALSKLGAISCKTVESKNEHDQQFEVTAEFENVEHAEAIHNLWRLVTMNRVDCTMMDEQHTDCQM